ncbi:hypothetical protein CgunFtcFv8_019071 [Champsocephalus gunnari]|uniref:Zyxin n=1 Tax=Champsocephalus gunnari TaxID=52237 RepID=A0AAN8DPB8_CHAGU|nr:hypothetical protein CgunFtcFv8_019071 [Champsocephalus gunnari]
MEESSSSKPFMVTSSLNFKVTPPSFYNQPKKFASVAPPRSKSVTPPSGPSPTPIGTAVIGRVGDLPPPPPSLCDDFPPPPPPPPLDDDLPAPPPECQSSSYEAASPEFPAPPPAVEDLSLPAPPDDFAPPAVLTVSPSSPTPSPSTPTPLCLWYSWCCWKPTETCGEADELRSTAGHSDRLTVRDGDQGTFQPQDTKPMGDRPPPAPWAEELKARTNRHANNHNSGPNSSQPLSKAPAVAPKAAFGGRTATSSTSLAQKLNQNLNQNAVPVAPKPSPASSSFPPPPAAAPVAPAPPKTTAPAPAFNHIKSSPFAGQMTANQNPPAAPAPPPPPQPKMMASPSSSFNQPMKSPPPPPQPKMMASPSSSFNQPMKSPPPPPQPKMMASPSSSFNQPMKSPPPPQPKMMASPSSSSSSSSFNQPMKSPPAATPSPSGPVAIPGGGVPLNMREVEELERMTKDFIRDMDTHAPVITSPPTEVCGKCGEALSRTQPAVRAMEKLFHSDCFCCLSCQRPLQGLQFYDRDGAPQCDDCYTSSLAVCSRCGERITDRVLKAVGQCFHSHCFRCSTCSCSLEGAPFITDDNNNPYCVPDYHRRFSPQCVSCNEPIVPSPGSEETVRVVALDKNFHLKCYRCEDCARPLSIEADENGCYPLDGKILCMKCHTQRAKQAAQ